jgi:hypothetical protein
VFSGDSREAVFENWESEFLQMFPLVILTVTFASKGFVGIRNLLAINRRKSMRIPESTARILRRLGLSDGGGFILKLYEVFAFNRAFALVFDVMAVCTRSTALANSVRKSFCMVGACESTWAYMRSAAFWFESFQNWQSEFLSVAAIVFVVYISTTAGIAGVEAGACAIQRD